MNSLSEKPIANKGFSLVELAVAIFVITLLMGTFLLPLAMQVEQRQANETQKGLEDIKEALIGFAVANGYLPCPDTDGNGVADPVAPGACANAEGFLPWITLNLGQADAWDNRFRYRVSPEFTNTPATGCANADGRLGLCDVGNITINTRDNGKNIQPLASNVVAVIVSHGKNGYGATSSAGTTRPAPPAANVDEATNANSADTTFVTRIPTAPSTTCSDGPPLGQTHCEFDDIVAWVPRFTLFNRMVAAGKLP